MRLRKFRGISFDVWNGRHTWFWFVADASRGGAAIGAAANEADAVREARHSIEEMAAQRLDDAVARGIGQTTAGIGSPGGSDAAWNDLLANLERYLLRLRNQCV